MTDYGPLFAIRTREGEDGPAYTCMLWGCMDEEEEQYFTFKQLLRHFHAIHAMKLEPKIDLCTDCEIIHQEKIDGILHHLHHLLEYEDAQMTIETDANITQALFLNRMFEKIKEINQEVWDEILGTAQEAAIDAELI